MSAGTMTAPRSEKLVVKDDGATGYLLDTAKFEQCYRIAKAMASASLLPAHLVLDKGKQDLPLDMIVGNCFRLVNQALRWGMDPFALPDETYVVSGKLGYQGKLVAAVINSRAGLKKPLSTIYNAGKGDDLAAVVFGSTDAIPKEAWPILRRLADGDEGSTYTDLMAMGVLCIRISVGQAKTDNKMWKSDPHQKLFYSGATKWARRHAPEIILGVLTDDDLDRMARAPAHSTVEDVTALLANGPPKEMPVEVAAEQRPEGVAEDGEILPFDAEHTFTLFAACDSEAQIKAKAKELTDLHPDQDVVISTIADQRREVIGKRK